MFNFFKKALEKTTEVIAKTIGSNKTSSYSKDALEEILIGMDIEYELVEKILEPLPNSINRIALYNSLAFLFEKANAKEVPAEFIGKPFVDLIVGVNGAGKTTTIAKLAKRAKSQNKSVILGAGDTFRAAAVEQLNIWANRLDVNIVTTKTGADPGAVAFDAINSAKAKGFDYALIDTAGRLHTQKNLAEELKKIVRSCEKATNGAPNRKIAILDGTAGSSAIAQAKAFDEMIGLTGVIVTKLDGTAKGGSIFSIVHSLGLPILYIGLGESADDLAPFDQREFINTLLDSLYGES